MSPLPPWIAAILALFGAACLPVSAALGITSTSDYVLDAAQISFILAAIIFLGYMAIGLVIEFIHS
jgi:hypothetical protein